jgi:hypothetical protein
VTLFLQLLFLHLSKCSFPPLLISLLISLFAALKLEKNAVQIGSFLALMNQWDNSNFGLSHIKSRHIGCYLWICAKTGLIHRLAVRSGLFSNPKMAAYGGSSGDAPAESSFRYGMGVGVSSLKVGKKSRSCNLIKHRTCNLDNFLCY